jgi:hypothetical protein
MTVSVSRKGDLIELGANGAYRLEQAVLVAPDGDEACHPTLAAAADEEAPARPWKLYKRVDTDGKTPDGEGVDQPTTYTYRYDLVREFVADDEEAAITEAKRLIAGG